VHLDSGGGCTRRCRDAKPKRGTRWERSRPGNKAVPTFGSAACKDARKTGDNFAISASVSPAARRFKSSLR
jgi:hypothetical protein